PGSVIVNHGATIAITGLTITGGYNDECVPASAPGCKGAPEDAFTSNTAEKGGGIYNEGGSITLAESIVTGNVATYYQEDPHIEHPVKTFGGGGIYTEGGSLTLTNSAVTNNRGEGKGGGIDNEEGRLKLNDSTVADNEAR